MCSVSTGVLLQCVVIKDGSTIFYYICLVTYWYRSTGRVRSGLCTSMRPYFFCSEHFVASVDWLHISIICCKLEPLERSGPNVGGTVFLSIVIDR